MKTTFEDWVRVLTIFALIALFFFVFSEAKEFLVLTEGKPEIRKGFALTWIFLAFISFNSSKR